MQNQRSFGDKTVLMHIIFGAPSNIAQNTKLFIRHFYSITHALMGYKEAMWGGAKLCKISRFYFQHPIWLPSTSRSGPCAQSQGLVLSTNEYKLKAIRNNHSPI